MVFEPDLGLISDMVLCEDAYTQERALLTYILERVQARDLLVFDRNFTTTGFAFGIAERGGSFVGRQHRTNLPVQAVSKLVKCGETETGRIYEQIVRATDPDTGATLLSRRIEIRLFENTSDGEKTIGLLTNLPATVSAVVIAEIYLLGRPGPRPTAIHSTPRPRSRGPARSRSPRCTEMSGAVCAAIVRQWQ